MKLFGIFSILYTMFDGIKDAFTPTIPAENWENKELQHQDRMNGMTEDEIIKNAQRGRYIFTVKYPIPHRNEKGQTMIENCTLWHEDLNKYGAVETSKWVQQGKYNLTPEERKLEDAKIELNLLELMILGTSRKMKLEEKKKKEELEKIISQSTIDLFNTEAVKLWQKARNADLSCKK